MLVFILTNTRVHARIDKELNIIKINTFLVKNLSLISELPMSHSSLAHGVFWYISGIYMTFQMFVYSISFYCFHSIVVFHEVITILSKEINLLISCHKPALKLSGFSIFDETLLVDV